MNFRNSKFALLLGAINGFLFGVAFQFVNTAYLAYDYRRMIVQFNGSPPSMYRAITPIVEYLFFILVFTLASYTVHRFWGTKTKSDIILWQIVAIVAIVVPSIISYVFDQVDMLAGAILWKLERGVWGYHSGVVPHKSDIEFAVLLLCLAFGVNFFYGAVVGKLSERFAK